MSEKKPTKRYIREEVIKELQSDIAKEEEKLLRMRTALMHASLGEFEYKISDFKGTEWSVNITLPCKSVMCGFA